MLAEVPAILEKVNDLKMKGKISMIIVLFAVIFGLAILAIVVGEEK